MLIRSELRHFRWKVIEPFPFNIGHRWRMLRLIFFPELFCNEVTTSKHKSGRIILKTKKNGKIYASNMNTELSFCQRERRLL